ncbi:MAG: hydrogenase maturation nickel metallochaperone HypA [Candidatus Omnitrophica bacterium]|nr:hydrogenase maturation nickel metallochaperone HypA [Candidatus Omnitrophota bacterium]
MHEMSLVNNMLKILEREITSPEIISVKKIHLEVGRMQYIVPDLMQTAFDTAKKSEKLKHTVLCMKVLPLKMKCKKCTKETSLDDEKEIMSEKCEFCGSDELYVNSGNEFVISSIEY